MTYLHLILWFVFSVQDQQVVSKVAYIEYDDATSAGVSLHLTNTVFIDRALMVVPVMDGKNQFVDIVG